MGLEVSSLTHKFQTMLKMLIKSKYSSLSMENVSDLENKFYNLDTIAQYYKTFYVPNLRIIVMS